MRYCYMDEEEIKLRSSLHNLKEINSFSYSSGVINISCKTLDGVNFSYDTRNKYFPLYYRLLLKAYEEEKENDEIIILGKNTKEILNNDIISIYPKSELNQARIVDKKIDYQKNALSSLKNIIIEQLVLLFNLQGLDVVHVSKLFGIRDNFTIIVETNSSKKVIPIAFDRISNFKYRLKLGNVIGYKDVTLLIDLSNSEIWVNFEVESLSLSGVTTYKVYSNKIVETMDVYQENVKRFHNGEEFLPQEKSNRYFELDNITDDYQYYELPNGLKVISRVEETEENQEKNIIYVYEDENMIKYFDTYGKYRVIDSLSCQTIGVMRINEIFKLSDMLVSQVSFDDIDTEKSLYRDVISNGSIMRVLINGAWYDVKNEQEAEVVKCMDSDEIRYMLKLEGK